MDVLKMNGDDDDSKYFHFHLFHAVMPFWFLASRFVAQAISPSPFNGICVLETNELRQFVWKGILVEANPSSFKLSPLADRLYL